MRRVGPQSKCHRYYSAECCGPVEPLRHADTMSFIESFYQNKVSAAHRRVAQLHFVSKTTRHQSVMFAANSTTRYVQIYSLMSVVCVFVRLLCGCQEINFHLHIRLILCSRRWKVYLTKVTFFFLNEKKLKQKHNVFNMNPETQEGLALR